MQIVIDIPEEIKAVIDKNGTKEIVTETVWQAVKKGTPLPKGHGRLIDADALYNELEFPSKRFGEAFKEILDDAQTIIEADKEACNEICNHYCEYPDIWDEEKDGELVDTKCINCPLNKL